MAVRSDKSWSWPWLLILLVAQLWLAHAIVFFAHEYSHTFVAWLLGRKDSPLDLHFPPMSLKVWLIQLGIDQNVDEGPIFASGHGSDAAIIALAGMVLGNGLITLPLSYIALVWAKRHAHRGWAMLAYLSVTASVGNLIDYVPIRTFTLDGDMGSIQRGWGVSPWVILVVLGIPAAIVLGYFLIRIVPTTLVWLFPKSSSQRMAMAALTGFVMFGFYGAIGLLEGGPIARNLSLVSVFVFLPIAAVGEVMLVRRPPNPDRA